MPLKNITNDIAVSANVSIRNPIRVVGGSDSYTREEIDERFNEVNEELDNLDVGEIQIEDVTDNLPTPSADFLMKIYRYNKILYQCYSDSPATLKDWTFTNITGASEITEGT